MSDWIKWDHYSDGSDKVTIEKSLPYKEGRAAYGRHYIDDCPYDEDSQEYDDWMEGYQDAGIGELLREEK